MSDVTVKEPGSNLLDEFDEVFNTANNKYATLAISNWEDLTDEDIKTIMKSLLLLMKGDFILRLGANAPYKDSPIADILKKYNRIEYYPAWKNFKKDNSLSPKIDEPAECAYAKLKDFYKDPDKFTEFARKYKAAEIHTLFGDECKKPSDIVVVWTPTAYEPKAEDKWAKPDYALDGQASYAIKIGKSSGIPIINLKTTDGLDRLEKFTTATDSE